jgi:hypothetical protein
MELVPYNANSLTTGSADITIFSLSIQLRVVPLQHQPTNYTPQHFSYKQSHFLYFSSSNQKILKMAEKEEPREEVVNETITLKVRDQAGEEMFFKVSFSI